MNADAVKLRLQYKDTFWQYNTIYDLQYDLNNF